MQGLKIHSPPVRVSSYLTGVLFFANIERRRLKRVEPQFEPKKKYVTSNQISATDVWGGTEYRRRLHKGTTLEAMAPSQGGYLFWLVPCSGPRTIVFVESQSLRHLQAE